MCVINGCDWGSKECIQHFWLEYVLENVHLYGGVGDGRIILR